MYLKLLIYILTISFLFPLILSGQEINTRFGKNRVQYSDDFDTWYRYETQNFVTYWYGKSRNVAIASMQLAEYDFNEIQNILEHRMNEKIELIVYGDIGELYQTNIGLQSDDPINVETIQLVGTKLYVHFDGNTNHLRESIREGIAKVYIYSMIYGSSFQEIVQNSFMSEMPEWFKAGIIAYTKNEWTDEDDAKMRFLIQEKRRPYRNFKKLSKKEPLITGKAFWYFLGENYGISSISNIIYLTRINRSVRSAFYYVLGEEYSKITKDFYDYYEKRYSQEKDAYRKISTSPYCLLCKDKAEAFAKNSIGGEYGAMKLSPDASKLAYVRNKNGRYTIFVQDVLTGKKRKIKSGGYNNKYRETDRNYPILFWSENGDQLGYIYEFRDVLQLRIQNLETKEKYKNTLNPIFNRVYSAAFKDDENLIFSGNTNGFSDLYSYNLNTRIQTNITEDFYNDLDADVTTLDGKKGIIFSSNRDKLDIIPEEIDTTIAINTFDLYFLDFENPTVLKRLTNTSYADEFKGQIRDNRLSYISDRYGLKSVIKQGIQNGQVSKNIESIQVSGNITDKVDLGKEIIYSTNYNNRDYLIRDTLQNKEPRYTIFKQEQLQKMAVGPVVIEEESSKDVDDIDGIPEGWFFQTRFKNVPKEELLEAQESANTTLQNQNSIHRFDQTRAIADRLRFKVLSMNSYLDNEPLFTGMNSYAGGQGQNAYRQAPLGLLLKMKIGDAFEDYIFEGGARFATNFSGYELYLTFEDRKHQWDFLYGAYYRSRSDRRLDQNILERNRDNTYLAYYQAKYPLDEFQSVRLSGTLRSDRDYTLITNESTFASPVINTQRIGARVEYVYDNSSQRSLNIYNGSRSKFFVESMNRFRIQVEDPFVIEPSNGFMTIIGLDSRYYYPIFEKSVLAARISAGTNFGSEKTLFYAGGVERSIFGGFDQSTGIPNEVYAFENIAPQLRGFDRNIRNGTSYVVSTVELRVPIFRHLFSDQLRYDFIREFQLVGFFDSGTAWHGSSPYSSKNPINSATFTSGQSVVLNVQYFRDPLVLGYGWGFRTSIFGYFLKVDFARGIETRDILPQRIHLSLGTDF